MGGFRRTWEGIPGFMVMKKRVQKDMGGHTRVHGDEEAARVDERDLPPLELEARQALNPQP